MFRDADFKENFLNLYLDDSLSVNNRTEMRVAYLLESGKWTKQDIKGYLLDPEVSPSIKVILKKFV